MNSSNGRSRVDKIVCIYTTEFPGSNSCCSLNSRERDNFKIFLVKSLNRACLMKHVECVKMLLKEGADPSFLMNIPNDHLPLNEAVQAGSIKCMEVLLDARPDIIDLKPEAGCSSLNSAVTGCDVKIVKFLLDKGANISKNVNGVSPLILNFYWARYDTSQEVLGKRLSITKMLIDKGADINSQDEGGLTPLHATVIIRNVIDHVKFLLDNGANPNIKDKKGNTPLHLIAKLQIKSPSSYCWNERVEYVELLLNAGAIHNTKNNKGETPLDVARNNRYGHQGLIKFLEEYQDLPE